jgi:hypothetical protein
LSRLQWRDKDLFGVYCIYIIEELFLDIDVQAKVNASVASGLVVLIACRCFSH